MLGNAQAIRPRNAEHVAEYEDPVEVAERAAAHEAAVEAARKREAERAAGTSDGPWAAGTGYSSRDHDGRGGADTRAELARAKALQRARARKEAGKQRLTLTLLRVLRALLLAPAPSRSTRLYFALDASALVPVLQSFLRSTELAITSAPELYR